ncbi:MAG: hypothetical protein K2Y21_11695 [Phycisphaerales bacterium]|nr:hypothetical protein [Phycisphaerales bacterium]
MSSEPGLTRDESAALLDDRAMPPKMPKKRPGKGRKLLIGAGVLVALAGGVIALLPTIAGKFVNGTQVLTSDQLVGSIQSTSLGWFGNQSARIALVDSKKKPAGALDITVDRSLLALATNWYDLGTIKVSGDVEFREGEAVVKPANTSSPSGGTKVSVTTNQIPLPKNLKAKLELRLSKLTALDKDLKPVAELSDVKADANLAVGSPITLDFSAKTGAAPLEAKVKIDNWTDANGVIHLDNASLAKSSPKVDAMVSAKDLSVALLDAIASTAAGKPLHLKQILGESLTFAASANGDYHGGAASLDVQSAGATANAKLSLKDGVIALDAPAEAKLTSAAAMAALDSFLTKEQLGSLAITRAPGGVVRIETLRAKLGDAGPDLRGGAINASLTLDALQGTLTAGETSSKVAVPSFAVTFASTDLSTGAKITAASSATIDSGSGPQNAGTLSADITLAGLLDNKGVPLAGLPKSIDGTVSLRGASTGVLQPFVAAALAKSGVALDLPRDIGPTADLELTAASKNNVIDVDLNAQSQSLGAVAALRVTDTEISARDRGVSLRLASAGQIASRVVKSDALSFPRTTGQVGLAIPTLRVPMDAKTRAPKLDQLEAKARVDASAWSVLASVPAAEGTVPGKAIDVDVRDLGIDVAITPGKAATAVIAGNTVANGAPMKIDGNFSLPSIAALWTAAKPATPNLIAKLAGAFYALGTIKVDGVPSSLAEALPGGGPVPALAREALGATFDTSVSILPSGSDGLSIKAALNSSRTNVGIDGELAGNSLVFKALGDGVVTPPLLDAVQSGPDKVTLRAPAKYTLTSEPVTIPLTAAGAPDFAKAGELKARLAVLGQAIIAKGDQSYGANDLTINVALPLSTLSDKGAGGEASVQATGGLVTPDGQNFGAVAARASAPLGAMYALKGPATIEVRVNDVATAGLDKAINQPGLVSGALGPTAQITASTRIDPRSKDGKSLAETIAGGEITADVTLLAPRVEIRQPLRATLLPDRIQLTSADPIRWTIDPAWFDRFVLGKGQPLAPGAKPTDLSMTGPAKAEVVINKAVISRANSTGIGGPLKPGIFALDAIARIDALELTDSRNVRTQMGDATVKLRHLDGAPGLAFDLNFGRLAIVPDPGKAGPGGGTIAGTVTNIGDASGTLNTTNPVITAKGDIKSIPTALIDAFSVKNGLPGEILGPSVNLMLDAKNFSKTGGTIRTDITSTEAKLSSANGPEALLPRAVIQINGEVQNGVLITPMLIALRRLDGELSRKAGNLLPTLAEVEKRFEDKQALIQSNRLELPLDGDLRKLNGQVTIEPGEVRFKLSGGLGGFLKRFNAKEEGKALQRLKPLTITCVNGVLSYPRWAFPVGEFNLELEGLAINLPGERIDVVTWVPFGQLADDAGKLFGAIPGISAVGGAINQATMMPFRTSGPLNNPSTKPDLELAGKGLLRSVSPERVLDILKDVVQPKK